ANGLAVRSRDGYARHRLEHELVHREVARHAVVVASALGDDLFAGADYLLGDAPRKTRVRIIARAVARRVHRERARLGGEDHETALGAQKRNGVIGDPLEQARQVVLGRELAVDLEDAAQTVL